MASSDSCAKCQAGDLFHDCNIISESTCDISNPSNCGVSTSHCTQVVCSVVHKEVNFEVKSDVNSHEEDCYDHVQQSIFYSCNNIPGPGVNLDDFDSQLAKGCDCTDGHCFTGDCHCISRFGPNYSSDGLLIRDTTNGSVVECNSECLCSNLASNKRCWNRLVQIGPLIGLEVFVTENKGYGLKCGTFIKKGSFICEYAGEVIGVDEARKRHSAKASSSSMNYVFVLNEFVGDTKVIKTCVDPETIGNIGRYVNHCCQPNCVIVPVRVESPVPRLGIFSSLDIPAGEEITFDYGQGGRELGVKSCHCQAISCRKYLPFEKDLLSS